MCAGSYPLYMPLLVFCCCLPCSTFPSTSASVRLAIRKPWFSASMQRNFRFPCARGTRREKKTHRIKATHSVDEVKQRQTDNEKRRAIATRENLFLFRASFLLASTPSRIYFGIGHNNTQPQQQQTRIEDAAEKSALPETMFFCSAPHNLFRMRRAGARARPAQAKPLRPTSNCIFNLLTQKHSAHH